MERLIRTTDLKIVETIVLIQNKKAYFYEVTSLVNVINLNLKCKNYSYPNISLTKDGFFVSLNEYESKKRGVFK